jgi:hypothetical protein
MAEQKAKLLIDAMPVTMLKGGSGLGNFRSAVSYNENLFIRKN